jgi:hypothetical protein
LHFKREFSLTKGGATIAGISNLPIMATVANFGRNDLAKEIARINRLGLIVLVQIKKNGELVDLCGMEFETFAAIVACNTVNPAIAVEIVTAPAKYGVVNLKAVERAKKVTSIMNEGGIRPIIFCEDIPTVRDFVLRLGMTEIDMIVEDGLRDMIQCPPWKRLKHMMCKHIVYRQIGPIMSQDIGDLTKLAQQGRDIDKSIWIVPETTNSRILSDVTRAGIGIVVPSSAVPQIV